MIRFDIARANRRALAALALTLAAAGLLAACGQGSKSTSVVLLGPPDKVAALVLQHKLLETPVQAHMEKLPDGRERAAFSKPGGIPAGELVDLGKAAAKAGVNFEFSSGTQWGSGSPPPPSPPSPSAKPNGQTV
jgi:hypothetical protein